MTDVSDEEARPKRNGKGRKTKTRPVKAASRRTQAAENVIHARVSGEEPIDDTVTTWLAGWKKHRSEAMKDVVNFVIRSTGCSLQLDLEDIQDQDHCLDRLNDLQSDYESTASGDYPLNARGKAASHFRDRFVKFFDVLIEQCHSSGILCKDPALIETLTSWISTMTASHLRPFRHTATTSSLAIGAQLAQIAADMSANLAQVRRQHEMESRKKTTNAQRISTLEKRIQELGQEYMIVEDSLKAIFDSVLVHRYRDVDPKIRTECVAGLGTWIFVLPDVFFEGIYLRYLGWVLSDTYAHTRLEVLRQLSRLYKSKDNVARLRTFTERFRTRLVEMAQQDADLHVRVAALDLLVLVRDMELLENDDIDAVGALILDQEPRVRKVAARFFAKNMNDLYDDRIDSLGGQEGLQECNVTDENTKQWLKFKCIAETLASLDASDLLDSAVPSLIEAISELRQWRAILDYMRSDMSGIKNSFEAHCQLTQEQTNALLKLTHASISIAFGEKRKYSAVQLLETFPDLADKFKSDAVLIHSLLRLYSIPSLEEASLDSELITTMTETLMKLFHGQMETRLEICRIFQHLIQYGDAEETAERKVQTLWTQVCSDFRKSKSLGSIQSIFALISTIDIHVLTNKANPIQTLSTLGQGLLDTLQEHGEIAMQTSLLLYMWQVKLLQEEIPDDSTVDLVDYHTYSSMLVDIIETLPRSHPTRIKAIEALLDVHTLFSTLRQADAPLSALVHTIESSTASQILQTFSKLESAYARRMNLDLAKKKSSVEEDIERLPEDDEKSDEGSEMEEDDPEDFENAFCNLSGKIVRALLARIFDSPETMDKVRKRICQHRNALGADMKAILAYLDPPKDQGKKLPSRKAVRQAAVEVIPEESVIDID